MSSCCLYVGNSSLRVPPPAAAPPGLTSSSCIDLVSSEEEDSTEAFHSDDPPVQSSPPDRAVLEARALGATPGRPLGDNALIHLQSKFPSAGGDAARTDFTPLYPERENVSNNGDPKLLEGLMGRYSTQIRDPLDMLWRDGPELDIQPDNLRVDKVRMPGYDAYGWQIVWACPYAAPGMPVHAKIEIDRDDRNQGKGIFCYAADQPPQLSTNPARFFDVKILRTLFVGRRGDFSMYSPRMRVGMSLEEARSTPSTLVNREMNSRSEQGLMTRPTPLGPGDAAHCPIDFGLHREVMHEAEPGEEGSPLLPAPPGRLHGTARNGSADLRNCKQRITIEGGIKGFLTFDGFTYLNNWKTQVNAVINKAARAQRIATATEMFGRLPEEEALGRLQDALEHGNEVTWVQLSTERGNLFRRELPPYLFLGQDFITKRARGCVHFDLTEASQDIENISVSIVQILPQDLVETVLDTQGLRACAKDIGWNDDKLLYEIAGNEHSGPNLCAGLKGYSMVFDSGNPAEFGWSLAVPTGQYLQAAAEGEASLRKDVDKGMWILGGCPARWPALCVGQHMVIVKGKKARRCAAHGSPKDRVLLKWAIENNSFQAPPPYMQEYWDMAELRNYCYPNRLRQRNETQKLLGAPDKCLHSWRYSGIFGKITGFLVPPVPPIAPDAHIRTHLENRYTDALPVPETPKKATPAPGRISRSFNQFALPIPRSHRSARLERMHLEAAKAEYEDTAGYLTVATEMDAAFSPAIETITDAQGLAAPDERGVRGVRVSLPGPRPPPPTCAHYKVAPPAYNTQAFRNTEGKRLSQPTDPDMHLPDKTNLGIQILILLSMGAEPCIDVADIESYFRNFSMPLYRQGTQATSIPFGPHGFGVHKRGEFGKFDMPAATTPAGIFICRATEYVLKQHEAALHGHAYPAALTAAMRERAEKLGDQHGQAIYSCIWIDDLLILYHDCTVLRDASSSWLSSQMAVRLGFTCAIEKQQLWQNQVMHGPQLTHRLNSFGAVADYVGLRIHVPRPTISSERELPVFTVQEPKRIAYADNIATLYKRKPNSKEYVRTLISTKDLQQITGQVVAAATAEPELLDLCRPLWKAGQTIIHKTDKGRRGPECEGYHALAGVGWSARDAARAIEHRLRNPTPLPAAPRVHYPHVRSPGVHLVFSDARRPGVDTLDDPALRQGEEFCFGWWCDLGPDEGVVYFQRVFTEAELKLGIPVLEYIGTFVAVMSTYAYWAALSPSGAAGHGHLIAMTDSKTVQQRFKGGKVKGTHMMQMHSLFLDALRTQSEAAEGLHQSPVTVGIDYFTRNYNLMADSLTHGARGIDDFKQLAAINGFARVREAASVPAIQEAVLRYGHMKWDTMLTS